MKFVDNHVRNVVSSIAAFLAAFWIFKFAGVSVDAGFWLMTMLLLLIYVEL